MDGESVEEFVGDDIWSSTGIFEDMLRYIAMFVDSNVV